MRVSLITLGMCLVGCSAGSCPVDAGSDAFLGDTGTDAFLARDAGVPPTDGCNPLAPRSVLVGGMFWVAEDGAEPMSCLRLPRVRLFRHGTTTVEFDSSMLIHADCPTLGITVPPGDYDLVAEDTMDPAWISGAELIRPEDCSGDRWGPYCTVQRVLVRPCETPSVYVPLYCDAHHGSCPASHWPWTAP